MTISDPAWPAPAALPPEELAARLATPGAARAALVHAAAQAGEAEAQLVYGQMLLDGTETPADRRAALDWFTRAAAQHHPMALNMVGRCYELGWGCAVDAGRAVACYRIAAGQGLAEAMYNYATQLALGHGVATDRAEALRWLQRAGDLGYAKAVNFIGSFAEDGWAGPRDMAKAARCYARAAEGGDFRAAFNHARMLGAGGQVEGALEWLASAVAGGTPAFAARVIHWCAASDIPAFRRYAATLREGRAC
ncbi:tetratricopeptide repeat protein [Sphingomonas sp. GM_Shp_2]|uniref:tetratricopeptide repeat protein n=1 Tax=Sphingomonas sp. GM_Shp_2 TaxID=2937380 RepID=UPI00226A7090|nr:tetratricopeptide repeat protein [Sphingomonas sp. GM_Shp_2]